MRLFPTIKPASPEKMGKIASMATLPLMAVVILMASRAVSSTAQDRRPPGEGMLVVANLREQSLTFHDLARETGTRTLILPGPPHEMVSSAGRIYATLGRANMLAEVDPKAPGVLRTVELDGEPHGIAVNGTSLLVTLDTANALARMDLGGLRESSRTPIGTTPHAIVVADAEVYVALAREDRLVELTSGPTVRTGMLPESVAIVGEFVVTANAADGTLSIFGRDGFRPIGTLPLGGSPVRIVPLDGARAIVALGSTAEAVVVDLGRMRIERRVNVGARPDGLCLSPSGAFIAVVSNADNLARVFRLPVWTPVLALVTGDGPGSCLWLAD
jgi:DNA-binding beta-propeller fold protein YncE